MKYYLTVCIMILVNSVTAQSLEWVNGFGGSSEDLGQAMCLDPEGNILLTGRFRQTIDFTPSGQSSPLTSNGSLDVFLLKMDAQGNVLWAKSFGGPGVDRVEAIYCDALGNIYLTGQFAQTVDFDPNTGVSELTSNGNFDTFILKLDTFGGFLWVKGFGGSGPDNSTGIAVDDNGTVYTTGYFNNAVDFDTGQVEEIISAIGQEDIFIHCLTSSGEFVWVKTFGGSNQDQTSSIVIDNSGNLIVGGWYRNTINFDENGSDDGLISTVSDNWDAFLLKLDSSGSFVWVRSVGGEDQDRILAIALDNQDNVFATGFFEGTADFDPGSESANLSTAQNSENTFVIKLDQGGAYQWAKSFKGGPQNNEGNGIDADEEGNVYTTGAFIGTVDFDPSSSSNVNLTASFSNLYVQKMDSDGIFQWVSSSEGSGTDKALAITIEDSGEIYLTGEFQDSVDFLEGPGTNEPINQGDEDIFILKIAQETTGLGDAENIIGAIAYPNPTSAFMKIQFHKPTPHVRMKLTDIMGQLVWEEYHEVVERCTIELGDSRGLYFLQMEAGGRQAIMKLLKQ